MRRKRKFWSTLGVVVLVGAVLFGFSAKGANAAGLSLFPAKDASIMCISCTTVDTFTDLFVLTGTRGIAFDSGNPDGVTLVLLPGHAIEAIAKDYDGTISSFSAHTDTEYIWLHRVLAADIVAGTREDVPPDSSHLLNYRPLVAETYEMTGQCIVNGQQQSISSTVVITHPVDEPAPGVIHSATSSCSAVGR